MAEWSKALVCKTRERKLIVGSNPSPLSKIVLEVFIGQMVERLKTPDCKSGAPKASEVQILLCPLNRCVAQRQERLPYTQLAVGSSPSTPTNPREVTIVGIPILAECLLLEMNTKSDHLKWRESFFTISNEANET